MKVPMKRGFLAAAMLGAILLATPSARADDGDDPTPAAPAPEAPGTNDPADPAAPAAPAAPAEPPAPAPPDSGDTQGAPEPITLAGLGIAGAGLAWAKRRRANKS